MTKKAPLGSLLMKVVPIAFVIGGAMELFMTYVRIGSETFYDTAKRLEMGRRREKREQEEEMETRVKERQMGNTDDKSGESTAAN